MLTREDKIRTWQKEHPADVVRNVAKANQLKVGAVSSLEIEWPYRIRKYGMPVATALKVLGEDY